MGLFEIAYNKGYKKGFLHNTLSLDLEEIIFPVKHYESVWSSHKHTSIFRAVYKRKTSSVYLGTT